MNTQIHEDACRNMQTNSASKNVKQQELQSLICDFKIATSCNRCQVIHALQNNVTRHDCNAS